MKFPIFLKVLLYYCFVYYSCLSKRKRLNLFYSHTPATAGWDGGTQEVFERSPKGNSENLVLFFVWRVRVPGAGCRAGGSWRRPAPFVSRQLGVFSPGNFPLQGSPVSSLLFTKRFLSCRRRENLLATKKHNLNYKMC